MENLEEGKFYSFDMTVNSIKFCIDIIIKDNILYFLKFGEKSESMGGSYGNVSHLYTANYINLHTSNQDNLKQTLDTFNIIYQYVKEHFNLEK